MDWVWALGLGLQGFGFRAHWALGLGIQGFGFRAHGFGFGFRVHV